MATGQTLLSLAAIVLLSIITMSIRQMYVQSVNNTVDAQYTSDALNFGRDLSERVHRRSGSTLSYNAFNQEYSNCVEPNNPEDLELGAFSENCKVNYTSVAGQSYIGLITISPNTEDFDMGVVVQTGRYVTVRVFKEENEDFIQDAEYRTIVTNFLVQPQFN